jgi:hypothetical protein
MTVDKIGNGIIEKMKHKTQNFLANARYVYYVVFYKKKQDLTDK